VVCGVDVEDVEDPLMQQIRWMDKLVDELASGKRMPAILRGGVVPSSGAWARFPDRPGHTASGRWTTMGG
jgi:hypothetical protein